MNVAMTSSLQWTGGQMLRNRLLTIVLVVGCACATAAASQEKDICKPLLTSLNVVRELGYCDRVRALEDQAKTEGCVVEAAANPCAGEPSTAQTPADAPSGPKVKSGADRRLDTDQTSIKIELLAAEIEELKRDRDVARRQGYALEDELQRLTVEVSGLQTARAEAMERLAASEKTALDAQASAGALRAAQDELRAEVDAANVLARERAAHIGALERALLNLASADLRAQLAGLDQVGCSRPELKDLHIASLADGDARISATVAANVFGPEAKAAVEAVASAFGVEVFYDVSVGSIGLGCPLEADGFLTYRNAGGGVATFRRDAADDLLDQLPGTDACAALADIVENHPLFEPYRAVTREDLRGVWAVGPRRRLGACDREGDHYVGVYRPRGGGGGGARLVILLKGADR